MKRLTGVIAAAGKGLRLYPYTGRIPKSLLSVDGISVFKRNVELLRDSLDIDEIYALVGYKKEMIMDAFGDGSSMGVHIKYIPVENVDKGLAEGILLVKGHVDAPFCLILGDEVYYKSNHREMLRLVNTDFSVVCAVKEVTCPTYIKRNYSVEIRNGSITSLIEKPKELKNNLMGCGTFLIKPDVLDYISKTPISHRTHRVELIDVINLVAEKTGKVYPFRMQGGYMNINNIDDYNAANFLVRSGNFSKKKISLIIPAFNEESSIGSVIEDFKDQVHEIIVSNNNSSDRTESIAREKGALVFSREYKGYGDALKSGMDNATGDIFILTEADGSFLAKDLGKILEYLKDADMVLGTRTTSQMVEQSANMNFLLRIGNLVVAKFVELLWLRKHEPRFTDVGCTYRGIWRSAYLDIRDSLTGVGPEFSPEMMIEAMNFNKRVIEIPVTYSGRIGGESQFSGSLVASTRTVLRMLKLILEKKMNDIFDKLRLWRLRFPIRLS